MCRENTIRKKIAIIGASYFQEPLIQKAKSMGIETHVFAWAADDVGEKSADFFYPISIVDKELILEKCREIDIDGICTIGSDLGIITSNYVANKMGLIANSMECTDVSTNKHLMRQTFVEHNDPSPRYYVIKNKEDIENINISFPAIVKPTDRSGSRGITKINSKSELAEAVNSAIAESFCNDVIVEEFIEGDEYSIEYISYEGNHQFLSVTKKYTTGAPHFIETGHIEPAPISDELQQRIKIVVEHALNSLGICYGASHSELKVNSDGEIKIVEIAGRMGGDFIGSNLVELSTGADFVKAVIDIALGIKPSVELNENRKVAGVRFFFNEEDVSVLKNIQKEHPEYIVEYDVDEDFSDKVTDSSNRHGYFIVTADNYQSLRGYFDE